MTPDGVGERDTPSLPKGPGDRVKIVLFVFFGEISLGLPPSSLKVEDVPLLPGMMEWSLWMA